MYKDSGLWENDQQRNPRSGSGQASKGKSHAGSKFNPMNNSWKAVGYSEPTPRKKSDHAGMSHTKDGRSRIDEAHGIQIGDNDSDDKSSS